MSHSVVATRFRSLARALPSRSRLFTAVHLVVLLPFVACAGDLNSAFTQDGGSGSATGGATGTGGTTGTGTGGSGATGTGGGGGTGGTTVACTYAQTVLSGTCSPGCHSPGGQWSPLDLSSDTMAALAIGKSQTLTCAADGQSKVINTGQPVTGSMITWLTGSTCGAQMPLPPAATPTATATPLTQTEIDCIKSYYASKMK